MGSLHGFTSGSTTHWAGVGWRWEDGIQGACCWNVGQLERERKRSNQSAVFQAGEPGAWANHLQCLVLDFSSLDVPDPIHTRQQYSIVGRTKPL